jgi:hypothetical protein
MIALDIVLIAVAIEAAKGGATPAAMLAAVNTASAALAPPARAPKDVIGQRRELDPATKKARVVNLLADGTEEPVP